MMGDTIFVTINNNDNSESIINKLNDSNKDKLYISNAKAFISSVTYNINYLKKELNDKVDTKKLLSEYNHRIKMVENHLMIDYKQCNRYNTYLGGLMIALYKLIKEAIYLYKKGNYYDVVIQYIYRSMFKDTEFYEESGTCIKFDYEEA